MPSYAHPPDPLAPVSGRVQVRRAIGRALAVPFQRHPVPASLPSRILLLRPDHLGDLLFVGPALRWLRANLPDAHIALAIGPWACPALPGLIGACDDLIEIPFPGFERGSRAGLAARWLLLPQMARKLRAERFDAALILRPDHWWGAMLAAWAGIPGRLGYATPETAPWLTTSLPLAHEHVAANSLRLAAALTGQNVQPSPIAHPLSFAIGSEDKATAQTLLASLPVDLTRSFVVIHPGSGAAVKLWDSVKWGEIARRLGERGHPVLVSGGPDEATLAAEVVTQSGGGAINLGGRTSFGVLAALLSQATLVLGPDSGPLHLAVAVGTPTIHLYGPADPVRYGPWGDPDRHLVVSSAWDCAPCGQFIWPDLPAHNCVYDIAVDEVWRQALKLLAKS
ncbi:MAG: glycosyltransferase family 9 protein [Caldilineales bacterium]|nr:glycosyltransferase family 9 protein [Caldilineales bacterium]